MAEALGAEILSVDSMLVYRGMDVGTAKPTAEQRARVPHHLLDLVEPERGVQRGGVPGRGPRGGGRRPPPRAAAAAGRGVGPVPAGGGGSSSSSRGPSRTSEATWRKRRRPSGPSDMHGRLTEIGSGRSGEDRARERPANRTCPRGRRDHREAVQLLRDGWDSYPSDRVRAAGVRSDTGAASAEASRRACRRCSPPAGSTRSRSSSPAGSGAGSRPRRPSATPSSPGISRASSSLEDAVAADRHSGPATSRGGRWRGSGVPAGSGGSTPARSGAASVVDELVAYLEGA